MRDRTAERAVADARALHRAVAGAPGCPGAVGEPPATVGAALATTGVMLTGVLERLGRGEDAVDEELPRVLARVERLDARLRRVVARIEDRRRTALERGLEVLRALGTTHECVEAVAPLALAACEADQVLLARVRDDVWSPWLVACHGRSPAVHPPGRRAPLALDDLPREQGVVRTGRVDLRHAAAEGEGSATISVLAPVTIGGVVLALLEVRLHPATVDAGTTTTVERFADALGRTFETLAVRDRLAAQARVAARLRGALGPPATPVTGPADELPTAELGSRPVVATSTGAAGRSALLAALTPRQRETLELMAQGLSNAEIAERLVVGVPTVKSHVTAILRAAGALNRAEAIRRYHDADPVAPDVAS